MKDSVHKDPSTSTYIPTMPFGKHKGTKMDKVPASYLIYIKEKFSDLNGFVKDYINDNWIEIQQRHNKELKF